MSKIIEKVYLGSSDLLLNTPFAKENGITHVINCAWEVKYDPIDGLTIFQCEGAVNNYFIQGAKYMNDALEEPKGCVYVHCKHGINRSPAMVIAFLILHKGFTYSEAKDFVKKQKPDVDPGHLSKLEDLYKNHVVNKNKSTKGGAKKNNGPEPTIIKPNATTNATESNEETKVETKSKPTNPNAVSKPGYTSILDQLEAKKDEKKVTYRCKYCRNPLFELKHIKEHTPKTSKLCSSYFLEEMPWMSTIPENDQKIMCPNSKCKQKLGDLTLSGRKCSCGSWVSPAFSFPKSNIDEIKPVNL